MFVVFVCSFFPMNSLLIFLNQENEGDGGERVREREGRERVSEKKRERKKMRWRERNFGWYITTWEKERFIGKKCVLYLCVVFFL